MYRILFSISFIIVLSACEEKKTTWKSKFPSLWEVAYADTVEPKPEDVTYTQFLQAVTAKLKSDQAFVDSVKGDKGDPGKSVAVFNSQGIQLGYWIQNKAGQSQFDKNQRQLLFSNGGSAIFDFNTGSYLMGAAVRDGEMNWPTFCYFAGNNCNGTCYAGTNRGDDGSTYEGLTKNQILFDGDYLITQGNETKLEDQTYLSRINEKGQCETGDFDHKNSWAVTSPYTFPSDRRPPFGQYYLGVTP
jgi:hypothetical protein